MKLAILGNSPLALEAALRFHFHGGAFTWYLDENDFLPFEWVEYHPTDFISEWGPRALAQMGRKYEPDFFQWKNWEDNYWNPLVQFLKKDHEIKTEKVVSIAKRFLSTDEIIFGKSRFYDLFRVIYEVNPTKFIEDQKENNPLLYQKLNEEFLQSLSSAVEMYEDFDIVLDLRTDLRRASANVSGRALGEGRNSNKTIYAPEVFTQVKNLPSFSTFKEIALIGSDSLSAEILLSLKHWLEKKDSMLFIITSEEDPFSHFFSVGNPTTLKKLTELLSQLEQEFKDELESYQKKIQEWQELDDFVKVKISPPVYPVPRLNFFSGHNVTAIDELIDKKRLFLTLEKPDFRQGLKHPENNHLDLKTIGVDCVLVSHAKKNRGGLEISSSEKGYFEIVPKRFNLKNFWENDLTKLKGVEDEIFKLFSPVDPH